MASNALPSQEVLRQLLRYEPSTGKLFWKERTGGKSEKHTKTWNSRNAGTEAFPTIHKQGYRKGTLLGVTVLAHRVAWAIQTGVWPDEQVDHINGMKSDNRWENLRQVTNSENCRNMPIPKHNTSGVLGVYTEGKGWKAAIQVGGKNIHLGCFRSLSDAAQARKEAENKYGYHANHGRVLI